MSTESDHTEKILGGFAVTCSILFFAVSIYAHFGRTFFLSRELVRSLSTKSRKYIIVTVAVLNWIYSVIYAEGYKYIRLDIIKLVKPVAYHLLVYILINLISIGFLVIALFAKKTYAVNVYTAYVIQWFGIITIVSNEIMFTSYPANIACAVILALVITPLVILIPDSLKIEKTKYEKLSADRKKDQEFSVPLNSPIMEESKDTN
jgi:hypothetical protein